MELIPPLPHTHIHTLTQERSTVLQALARKARMVYECMNRIPGVYCNEVQGAMYAFLRVEILVRRPGLMLRYSILGQSILLNPIPFQFHSGSIPFRFGSILAHSIRTSTLLQAISITFHAQSHSIHFCEPELYLTLPVHTHTHTHTHTHYKHHIHIHTSTHTHSL